MVWCWFRFISLPPVEVTCATLTYRHHNVFYGNDVMAVMSMYILYGFEVDHHYVFHH